MWEATKLPKSSACAIVHWILPAISRENIILDGWCLVYGQFFHEVRAGKWPACAAKGDTLGTDRQPLVVVPGGFKERAAREDRDIALD
jgi:hypothetical protein